MSWDAYLVNREGLSERWWNHTHNCNAMITIALDESGFERPLSTRDNHGKVSWWDCLNGLPGPEGAALLHRIIRGLEGDPGRFEAMNPTNEWGSYLSVLEVLLDMRASVPEWPTTWEVSG